MVQAVRDAKESLDGNAKAIEMQAVALLVADGFTIGSNRSTIRRLAAE